MTRSCLTCLLSSSKSQKFGFFHELLKSIPVYGEGGIYSQDVLSYGGLGVAWPENDMLEFSI